MHPKGSYDSRFRAQYDEVGATLEVDATLELLETRNFLVESLSTSRNHRISARLIYRVCIESFLSLSNLKFWIYRLSAIFPISAAKHYLPLSVTLVSVSSISDSPTLSLIQTLQYRLSNTESLSNGQNDFALSSRRPTIVLSSINSDDLLNWISLRLKLELHVFSLLVFLVTYPCLLVSCIF